MRVSHQTQRFSEPPQPVPSIKFSLIYASKLRKITQFGLAPPAESIMNIGTMLNRVDSPNTTFVIHVQGKQQIEYLTQHS